MPLCLVLWITLLLFLFSFNLTVCSVPTAKTKIPLLNN